ncbi:MAG: glycosyltransferase family 9 protein [Deltaproteobacteria bacterium]|nr:glycosyltransferase family 9 protein [Deltaproteobacteria bacterium]
MKVLIIKLSSIGDCVQTLPALYALRKGFGKKGIKARIDWLVEEAASSILKDNQMLDNLIVVKRGWAGNLKENLKAARSLASEHYDIVIDFQGLLKSAVWVMLSGGKRRIGFRNGRELSHLFLNEKLPAFDLEMHAVDRYLSLAKYLGGLTGEAVFPIDTGKESSGLKKKLKESGIKNGSPFFVMVTRARWATKLWTDRKFVEAARRIIDKTGMQAVLAGGASDSAALDKIRDEIGHGSVNLAGRTDLKELAALFKMASFVITVDSGPMHMASAVGAKTVALFGPTAPWRTGPYGKGHIIIRKGVACSPCFKKRCGEPKCMEGITVEEVVEGALKITGK